MRRLLAVALVTWMAACSTAPSASTASDRGDDRVSPPTATAPMTTQQPAATAESPVDTATIATDAPATATASTTTTTAPTTTTTAARETTTTTTTSTTTSVAATSSTTTTVGTTTTTEAEAEIVEIEIENFRFVPAEVTVRVGDTVRWTVRSGTHTTTADGAVWSSPAMASGASFSWTSAAPGTIGFFCAIHPGMRGTITVET